jgi:pyruvate,orthophosphate dikinase
LNEFFYTMKINQLAKQYVYWPELENKYQQPVDISKVTVSDIHPTLLAQAQSERIPVSDGIIRFYVLNETLARIRQEENEILDNDAFDLYQYYLDEIDTLSEKVFSYVFTICMMESRHCHDFHSHQHLVDSFIQSNYYEDYENGKVTQEQRDEAEKFATEREATIMNDYASKIANPEVFERFKIFHKMASNLSVVGSYDYHNVIDTLLPLFQMDEFKDITISECLDFLAYMFRADNFESGYGGPAWAQIAEHGSKFLKGQINAEVFVDQTFSLEHNGGQIFNKRVIYCEQTYFYFRQYNQQDRHSRNFNVWISQFLLNAQHQGQLLTLLNTEYSPSWPEDSSFTLEALNKAGLADATLDEGLFNKYRGYATQNLEVLEAIFNGFKSRNSEFISKLGNVNVSTPELDFYAIFHHIKDVERNVPEITPAFKPYYKIQEYLIAKNNKPSATIELQDNSKLQGKAPFIFEYYDVAKVPVEKQVKEILGNKAYNLMKMQEMNLPVPQATVFPATNSASFFKNRTAWMQELKPALTYIQSQLTDSKGNPVLCSVRSGSAISMPGMMDTILNVGIDDTNYDYFSKKLGKKVVHECSIKFMSLFSKSLFGENAYLSNNFHKALFQFRNLLEKHDIPQNFTKLFPLSAKEQYKWCLQAVFKSWHSERATAYRNHHGISHDIGTAAIIQKMVFGNLNNKSCTGVAFSRDCISGKPGIIGEFLIKAQGEDVVSGAVTPTNIKEMQQVFPQAYDKLIAICAQLETQTGDIQDIEFTVENNQLYILQKRKAVCSGIAQAKLNQERFEQGLMSHEDMVKSITLEHLLPQDMIDAQGFSPCANGLIANVGVMRGIVIHNDADMETHAELFNQHRHEKNFGWIFYAPETSPEHAPIMIKTQAFITGNGGFTSHAAILARSWKKPCVVGVGEENAHHFESGKIITVDATNGHIYTGVLPVTEANRQDVSYMVSSLLSHYQVNLDEFNQENPFNEHMKIIREKKCWMEKFDQFTILSENKRVDNDRFLSLGEKIALMLAKAQHENPAKRQLKREKI